MSETKINASQTTITAEDIGASSAFDTMPTAAIGYLDKIVQYVGTTDATYTNGYFYKCVSDGQNPATYSWSAVEVQASSGGGSLPSQTGNAGKFLTTDGTDASWGNSTQKILIPDATSGTRWQISRSGIFGELVITQPQQASTAKLDLYLAWNAIYSLKWDATLGTSDYKWNIVYANKINHGADIVIPTTGGTMAVIGVNTTITLAAANWSSNTQTVNVTGITATGVVFVNPDPADQSAYTNAGILCTAQAAGTLTFTCDTTPSNDIDVVVVMI